MGPDFDDVDWRTLDPRQYDPRRIIREALLDDAPVPTVRAAGAAAAVASTSAVTEPERPAVARFSGEDRRRTTARRPNPRSAVSGSDRPARPREVLASLAASSLMATAAGSAGWASTTGVPASPSARRCGLSGIEASSGTAAPSVGQGRGDLGAAALTEQRQRRAVGQGHRGHVLHDTDHALAGLARDQPAAHGDVGCRGLRRRDDDDLGVRQQLAHRDGDVARARRHVEQQHVEIAEEDVGQELLHGAVQHRAPPGDGAHRRLPVAAQEHADRDDLHAVGDRRQHQVVDAGRLPARRRRHRRGRAAPGSRTRARRRRRGRRRARARRARRRGSR